MKIGKNMEEKKKKKESPFLVQIALTPVCTHFVGETR
jgi:hypothetical protein